MYSAMDDSQTGLHRRAGLDSDSAQRNAIDELRSVIQRELPASI